MLDIDALEYKEAKRITQELDVEILNTPFTYRQEPYFLLSTRNALHANKLTIILPGIPEKLAFWSYSLVKTDKSVLSSKYSYFQSFLQRNLGLISLAPHLYYTDTTGENYILQLGYILQKVKPSTKIILLGYSFGGMQLFKILKANPHIQKNIHGLIFLDYVDKLGSGITWCENVKLAALLCLSNDFASRIEVTESTEFMLTSCQTEFLNCSHDELPSAALAKYVLPFIDKAI